VARFCRESRRSRGRRVAGEERVDAIGDDPGGAVGGCQFALGRDGGEQPRGVPAVALCVEQPPGNCSPRGVGRERTAAFFAERGDGGEAVAAVGVVLGGVQVAGDEGGERPGLLLGDSDGLGGGQRGALGGECV
jgi:hypothetical protein